MRNKYGKRTAPSNYNTVTLHADHGQTDSEAEQFNTVCTFQFHCTLRLLVFTAEQWHTRSERVRLHSVVARTRTDTKPMNFTVEIAKSNSDVAE